MKFFDAFSGYGGFHLGVTRIVPKAECIGYSEIDKYASAVYKHHFEGENYGDITKINPDELPDFDLFCGGFPCQAFSIAGKRRGFDDTRGTLIYDVLRILKAKKPMYALLENVKGLVSHDGGRTLEVILESLQELGYYANIEIYNAKDFSVPQNRERIFILCKHKDLLTSIGENEKITTSEKIIQEYLFQTLLNNLKEVQKLQETASKDWVVGYLLWKEISQNLKLKDESIKVGISMDMADGLFQLKAEDLWQNIATYLKTYWEENYLQASRFTTSTALKQITDWKTCTFTQMLLAISTVTVVLRDSSENLWNEILSSLIIIQEGTNYARINDKKEKTVITEDNNAHFTKYLQDPERVFIIGHLGGFGGRQVFPIREANTTTDQGFEQKNTEIEIASTLRSRYGNGSGSHIPVLTPDRLEKRQNGRRFKTDGEPMFTLNTQDKHGVYDGYKIRRLTPTECERLMGLPDGWTAKGDFDGEIKEISDTQRYKLCGNGVVVNVVKEIIKRLFDT